MSRLDRKTLADWIGAVGFVALLALPLAGQIVTPARQASALERRTLARAPDPAEALRDWRGFPDKLDAWLEDRFGFRDALLALYVVLDRAVNVGVARDAVRGDDGWLFIAAGDVLASHQGRYPFEPGEAEAWLDSAEALAAQARATGAAFAVLAPPDKNTVYPEHLSAYPRRFAGETRRETLARLAGERGLVFVSPLDELAAAKAEGEVYYRTDTHWTDRGAYVAYRALMEALAAQGVPAETLGEERLAWREGDHVGDIYGLLGEANGAPEPAARVDIVDPVPVEEVELPELTWEGFPGRRWVSEARARPSILVMGDSFSNALIPYLTESFGEVTFVHHQFGRLPPEALEPGRYDAIVLEMVERFLNRPFVFAAPESRAVSAQP